MKLGDLNASHLGKTITISYTRDAITGQLAGVNHHAAIYNETRLADSEPRLSLGRALTAISILDWGERKYDPATECEVQE